MTAVRGPFVFTSDVFRDDHITKAKAAGCGAIALQLGVATTAQADKARAAGLQIIAWGTASPATHSQIGQLLPSVWMPQAETTPEFDALITALRGGAGGGLPCEPVMTAGGIDIAGTDAEKVANRVRRHNLLESFGVKHVWVEVYIQDADKANTPRLGDVNHMISFFENDLMFGAGNAHPVIGLWTAEQAWATNPYKVSRYDLSRHGRTFGAWRAEQMDDPRYPEMKAVPDVVTPPQPPKPKTRPQYRAEIAALAKEAMTVHQTGPHHRFTVIHRQAGSEFPDDQWRVELGPEISLLLDQAKGDD